MKIIHICTSTNGGAGLCAQRINKALIKAGIDSKMIVAFGQSNDYTSIVNPEAYPWSKFFVIQKIQVLLNKLNLWPDFEYYQHRIAKAMKLSTTPCFTSPVTNYKHLYDHPWIQEADVIHLHWVGNFLDYRTFFEHVNKPIVWTLHDENPGFGGSHYSKWEKELNPLFKKLENKFLKIKQNALSKSKDIHLVAISKMMRDFMAHNDILRKYPITLIHNGIEEASFKMLDKESVRIELGLQNSQNVFLFAAYNIHEYRKGLALLIESLERLNLPNSILICLGNYQYIPQTKINIRCEGYIQSTELQSKYYSAADYFCMPSFQEAFAQTPMEAMACGTPVIAFPCSGTKELINDAEIRNGVVCDDFSIESLTKGIQEAMSYDYDSDYIRKNLIKNFSYNAIAARYMDLYNRLIS